MKFVIRIILLAILALSCHSLVYSMDIAANERICFYEVFGKWFLTQKQIRNIPMSYTLQIGPLMKSKCPTLMAASGRTSFTRKVKTHIVLEWISWHQWPPLTPSVSKTVNHPWQLTKLSPTLGWKWWSLQDYLMLRMLRTWRGNWVGWSSKAIL